MVTGALRRVRRSHFQSGHRRIGAAARFQRNYDGVQPRDPVRAAAAIIHVASPDQPPLPLLLGSDAVKAVERAEIARIEVDRKWRDLSISTDFIPDFAHKSNGKD